MPQLNYQGECLLVSASPTDQNTAGQEIHKITIASNDPDLPNVQKSVICYQKHSSVFAVRFCGNHSYYHELEEAVDHAAELVVAAMRHWREQRDRRQAEELERERKFRAAHGAIADFLASLEPASQPD